MKGLSSKHSSEKGQGLVEYALLLTLVAVVVIGILSLLGTSINNVYLKVVTGLQSSGVITSVSVARGGGGNANNVTATIAVSENTNVTVTDSQSGQTQTTACNGSCSVTLTEIGNQAGMITVTADAGGVLSAGYAAK